MNAGRELDALVAEKVMGWREVRCNVGGNIPYGEPDDDWNRDARADPAHGFTGIPRVHREEVPDYSTSIAEAWLVVEKLSGQFAVNLSCTSQPVRWLCEFSRSENVWFNAHGRTPAEAICLAALKAIGYHDESH